MNRLCLVFFLIFATEAFSQPAQFFLGNGGIQQVLPAPDGNYFLLGSSGGANSTVRLLKINPSGSTIWQKNYSAIANEYGCGLTLLADNSLLITGQSGGTALAIKTDANGNQIWKHTYANTTALFDATPSGNNFLFVGWTDTPGSTNEGLLMLVNGSGILQWKLPVEVFSQTYVKRIFPTNDGNFLLVGRSNVIGAGFEGVFLRKIKPDGGQIWQVTHDTGFRENDYYPPGNVVFSENLGAVLLPDQSIWITNPYQYDADIALIHFSPEGDLLGQKIYGNPSWREYPYSLNLLPEGGWLISGACQSNSSPLHFNGFALRTTPGGLEIWRKYYGLETAMERLFGSAATPDGQFLLAGMSNSPSGGGSNSIYYAWLLRTEADGNVLPWKVNGHMVIDLDGDCIADPGEPPAAGWFILAENTSAHTLMTDFAGNFTLNTVDATTQFTGLAPDPAAWAFCNNGQTVESNSSNPVANLIFLVNQTDGGCPLTEVGITQPDLVRCDTSRFFITVANRGLGESGDLLLDLELDPAYHLVSASEPFTQSANTLEFIMPPMQGLQSKTLEIWVRLSCNVQLGAIHPIVARISPLDCAPSWNGALYSVEGRCEDDFARFDLRNLGGGGAGATTVYRVMADDLLAADWTEVGLPEGAPAHTLDFPADGRTWRVELQQTPGYPFESHPAAAIEGCGLAEHGLNPVSFLHTWRYDDGSPEVSAILPPNTTRVPDKIAEAVHGLGRFNLHGDLRPLEFTARVRNPLPEAVQKVSFQLTLSPTLDVTTFRPLASNTPVEISLMEDGMINAVMENIQLDTGSNAAADAMLRFSVQPYPATPPDSGDSSLLLVEGKAFLDETGPFELALGFLNYTESFPVKVDAYNNYPPEMLRFGARNITFGNSMAQAADSAVFLVGETLSYSDRTNWDGLLVKTDQTGKVFWLNAIDLGDRCENSFWGVAPLSNGGCLAVGNYRLAGTDNYVSNNHAYIAGIDQSGKLLWHKKFRPAGEQYGAWTNGIVETADGNFVMYGYSINANGTGTDPFYIKINEAGEVLWQQYEEISGSAFKPHDGILLPDGGLVFAGPNQSTAKVFLQKINPAGSILWSSGHDLEEGSVYEYRIAPAADGGIMFAGTAQWEIASGVYGTTPVFLKFDHNGNFEWEKKPVIGPFNYALPRCIKSAPDGGYLVGGEILTDTLDHFFDFMLLKIDENADTVWCRNYGVKNFEWVEDLLVTSPEQILLWGYNQSRPPLWDLRAVLARTDWDGKLTVDTKGLYEWQDFRTVLFPNPAQAKVNVVLSPPPVKPALWLLADLSGRVVEQGVSLTGLLEIGVERLPSGFYFLAFPGSRYPSQRVMVVK